MTAGKPTSISYAGGKLVVDPTNLGAAYPYGGTEVGLVRELEYGVQAQEDVIEAEEFGAVIDVPIQHESLIVACNVRGWDINMMRLLVGGASSGSGARTLVSRAYTTSGSRVGQNATYYKILFVPDDRANGIALYLPRAAVMRSLSSRVSLSYGREYGWPVIFRATLDSGGRGWQEGIIGDLTL